MGDIGLGEGNIGGTDTTETYIGFPFLCAGAVPDTWARSQRDSITVLVRMEP
jgi:hypothetical protein